MSTSNKFVSKIIKKLSEPPYHVTYRPIKEKHKIDVYTNVSFGNLSNGGGQGAFLIFVVGDTDTCNLISWWSKRVKRVAKRSIAAETVALSEGPHNGFSIATLYSEILDGNSNNNILPIVAYVDNKSLIYMIQSTKSVAQLKK